MKYITYGDNTKNRNINLNNGMKENKKRYLKNLYEFISKLDLVSVHTVRRSILLNFL